MTGRDVYEKLMREIAAGKFAKNGKLPSESELGKSFEISRMTVRRIGKRVPEDVAVIGFDDIALARTTEPSGLTSPRLRDSRGRWQRHPQAPAENLTTASAEVLTP